MVSKNSLGTFFKTKVGWNICALTLLVSGCAKGTATFEGGEDDPPPQAVGGYGGAVPSGGGGGSGGTPNNWPCGIDCSAVETPPCLVSECNQGQYTGDVGSCVVIDAPDGTACEDGQFCTKDDECSSGSCVGGPPNDCDMTPGICQEIACDEGSDSCSPQAGADGQYCVPTNLCEVNGQCQYGQCVGSPKDCSFSPVAECNIATCDPQTGDCVGNPDPTQNGQSCSQTGDPCMVDKTCLNGQCQGGTAKDCSHLTVDCNNGVCDPPTGLCIQELIQPGGACLDGTDQCNDGICDSQYNCVPTPVQDGTQCDDYNSCTTQDSCTGGVCGGNLVPNCTTYFEELFEGGCPPGGWTLNPDWECGTPTVGPVGAYSGSYCLGTVMAGNYADSRDYQSAYAQTPPIDLSSATEPKLAFYAWVYTEGSSFDGYHVEVSNDGGQTFSVLNAVVPAYDLTIDNQPAWGGDLSLTGWYSVLGDLSAFVGQQVILRFAFHSDGSVTYPGVYLDEVRVAEASAMPIAITTTSPLPFAVESEPYSVQMTKTGGSSGSQWSIVAGSNHGWLSIDPATGVLSGTPALINLGPVSVTINVVEPNEPTNFDQQVFTFDVLSAIYFENFEGTCPVGWTLGGDWQCGTPSTVGPTNAFSGTQCLATQISQVYSDDQEWLVATATSPPVDLTTATNPQLTWRCWLETEGSIYDGANLKISVDGGSTYQVVSTVTPAYGLTIDGEDAWGGSFGSLGWQEFTADLSAFVGQNVLLRFAFHTDSSVTYPGVYIDDVLLLD